MVQAVVPEAEVVLAVDMEAGLVQAAEAVQNNYFLINT